MKGFGNELQQLFRGSLADALVEWRWNEPSLEDLKEQLEGFTHSPTIESFAILKTELFAKPISFKGIEPSAEKELRQAMGMSSLHLDSLNAKSSSSAAMGGLLGLFGESSKNEAVPMVVGDQLAEDLNLEIGDRVTMLIPSWSDKIAQGHFVVKSLFHSGYLQDDSGKVFIHIDEARRLQGRNREYDTIQVAARPEQSDLELCKALSTQLEKFDSIASVSTWRDRHSGRLAAVVHERKLISIVLSLIVIVASFAILTIQWSFVKEKSKDIGILRAMGFSSASIFTVFLGASWMVGLVGLILGLGAGVLISANANEIIAFTGWRPFPGELYYHQKLPVLIELSDVTWISLLSLSVTTLAGICPAWKATRLEPVQAMARD